MYDKVLIAAALVIALACLLFFAYRAVKFCKYQAKGGSPLLSMVFCIFNQQEIIEGLIKKALAVGHFYRVEIIAVNHASSDQTGQIIERLAKKFNFRYLSPDHEIRTARQIQHLSSSNLIFCFDLTGPVDYRLLVKSIQTAAGRVNS